MRFLLIAFVFIASVGIANHSNLTSRARAINASLPIDPKSCRSVPLSEQDGRLDSYNADGVLDGSNVVEIDLERVLRIYTRVYENLIEGKLSQAKLEGVMRDPKTYTELFDEVISDLIETEKALLKENDSLVDESGLLERELKIYQYKADTVLKKIYLSHDGSSYEVAQEKKDIVHYQKTEDKTKKILEKYKINYKKPLKYKHHLDELLNEIAPPDEFIEEMKECLERASKEAPHNIFRYQTFQYRFVFTKKKLDEPIYGLDAFPEIKKALLEHVIPITYEENKKADKLSEIYEKREEVTESIDNLKADKKNLIADVDLAKALAGYTLDDVRFGLIYGVGKRNEIEGLAALNGKPTTDISPFIVVEKNANERQGSGLRGDRFQVADQFQKFFKDKPKVIKTLYCLTGDRKVKPLKVDN